VTLAPLLAAPAVIQLHAFAALVAFALGAVQLAAPKGTIPHRLFGWLWGSLMLAVVLSSFFIHTIRLWGREPDPPLVAVHLGHVAARRPARASHQVERHRRAMTGLFVGALVIAGIFTLLPGRIMHDGVFGP